MPQKLDPEWLTASQLAALLNVTTMSIFRWRRDTRLGFPEPAIINERRYWRKADVDQWMRSRGARNTQAA